MVKKGRKRRTRKTNPPNSPRKRIGAYSPLSESDLEETFLREFHLSFPTVQLTQQYQFHPEHKFRFDFAIIPYKIAFEIQGYGTGHTSYTGMERDYYKHNEANRLGWIILYFMSIHLTPTKIGATMLYIQQHLKERHGYTYGTNSPPTGGFDLFNYKVNRARGGLNQTFDSPKIPREDT